jgi:hydroxyacylglutathione hydrolase
MTGFTLRCNEMIHEILPVGPLQCNCSIFGDETTREAVVVDPGDDISDIQTILDRHHLRVTAIVITHAHIDHIGGAEKLKKTSGAPVYMNENDRFLSSNLAMQAAWLGVPPPADPGVDVASKDGDVISLAQTSFHVLHTPGHTPGSISLWIPSESKLVAGDTLFRDSIGRTDLPGGNYQQEIASIREKLLTLPEESVVIPGHGGITTIGREKERNPFLNETD